MEDNQNTNAVIDADLRDEIPEDGEANQNTELVSVDFRHKTIRRFKVGEFEFSNGILTIGPDTPAKVQEKVDLFRKYWQGLQPVDKNAIVRLRNVRNEVGVDADDEPIRRLGGGAIRGPVSTEKVADKPAVSEAAASAPLSTGLRFGTART